MREEYFYPHEMFEVNANGQYCGVFMPGHVMKKLMKISSKWSSEIQQLLNEHKTELFTADWTLANTEDENGKILKQEIVKYSDPNDLAWNTVENRISLFKPAMPRHTDIYLCDRETALKIAEEILKENMPEKEQTNES